MATAIEFENISKQYRLGLVSTKTLSHDLNRWWQTSILGKEDPYLKIGETNDRATKGESEYVWALKDINFKIEQGDVVGIIGKNGAGKSTLLKLLSRVTGPTTGTIRARGRIASLLEVGTGFHPEMTGRENIYLNGAIMGMTKAEIDRKLDEIVDFSGCERYLDTPVKRYSSGMTVRLGFAVAAHLDPEILVVEEVLAVGDAEFQKKAIGKMQDVSRGEGRTVLFVSHNMASIKSLCNSGVILQNGQMAFAGTANEAVERYLFNNALQEGAIIDAVRCETSDLLIHDIRVNGKSDNIINVGIDALLPTLDIEIEGEWLTDNVPMELEFRLTDDNERPFAFFSSGHSSGQVTQYRKGSFCLHKMVAIPQNLTRGALYLDLELTHPNVRYWMRASRCVRIEYQGISNAMGSDVSMNYNGFFFLDELVK